MHSRDKAKGEKGTMKFLLPCIALRYSAVSPRLKLMLGVNSGLTAWAAAKRSLRAWAAAWMEMVSP